MTDAEAAVRTAGKRAWWAAAAVALAAIVGAVAWGDRRSREAQLDADTAAVLADPAYADGVRRWEASEGKGP